MILFEFHKNNQLTLRLLFTVVVTVFNTSHAHPSYLPLLRLLQFGLSHQILNGVFFVCALFFWSDHLSIINLIAIDFVVNFDFIQYNCLLLHFLSLIASLHDSRVSFSIFNWLMLYALMSMNLSEFKSPEWTSINRHYVWSKWFAVISCHSHHFKIFGTIWAVTKAYYRFIHRNFGTEFIKL